MLNKKSIEDINIKNKRIFLRVDFNVPIKDKSVECTHKITSTIPTIEYILKHNPSKLIVATHLGRPKNYDESLSVKPIVNLLNQMMNTNFVLKNLNDIMDEKYIFLENLRFNEEEKEGYGNFFVKNADLAVLDAFGCAHRNDKSITGTKLPVYMGLLFAKEIDLAKNILNGVDLCIFGGAKISDKIKLISDIKSKEVWMVGALANTILKYKKINIGKSKSEENVDLSKVLSLEIKLPTDFITKDSLGSKKIINDDECIIDIGEETRNNLRKDILKCKKVFWNGPAGIFENKESQEGTKAIAEGLQGLKEKGGICYVGGGETAMAALMFGDMNQYTHVSTGGGALMTLLSGGSMPGIDIIENK